MFGNTSNFSTSEIINYCKKYNIKYDLFFLERRQRDSRITFEFWRVLKKVKGTKPDIIYTYCFDNPYLSLPTLILDPKKTIVFIHDVEFHSRVPFAPLLKMGRKIIVKRFNLFQVFSQNQAAIFRKRYPQKNVFTIPLPLTDFNNSIEYNSCVTKDKTNTKFLFFGNILPYKGLELLITAINSLQHRYDNIELIIAGRCENWDTFYEPMIINKNRVTRIIRHITNAEIVSLFSKCHYLILPYKDATQSGPLMIAYNYGLPVIASNIEPFKEVIKEGKSGYLFDFRNPKSLEVVMEAAINQDLEEYNVLLSDLKDYVETTFAKGSILKKFELMFSNV
jgi:glycosyltransferase involved in cell wall biosynthesis